jgi:signal transduction histidine kinase
LRWDEKIIKKQKINIWTYIKDFSKEYIEIADTKNIKIIIEEKNELIIENNTYYLDRLFWNLISNAIFYNIWDNKIKIIIDKNSIEIIDSWIWIHENEINKIFSRFYRSQNSNLYDDQWNWLWMTIVKKICDKFGWQIDIKSELNKWTNIK